VAYGVYLTGLEPGGGKSGIALGLAAVLSRRMDKLGAFRPLARQAPDPIVELLTDAFPGTTGGYGMTYPEAAELVQAGAFDEVINRIVQRYRDLAADRDAMVIVGSDFGRDSGDASDSPVLPDELTFNVRLANECGAAVVAVVDGVGRRDAEVEAAARTAYHSLVEQHATVAAVIANRVAGAGGPLGLAEVPAYAVPLVPAVAAPAVAQVVQALAARVLVGDSTGLGRDVSGYVVGGAHVPTFLDHLHDGCLVLTPGDRADLVVAAAAAHSAGHTSLAGILLTLGIEPDPRAIALVDKLNPGLPILSVARDSFETVTALRGLEGRLTTSYPRKVEAALAAFETSVDTNALADRLALTRSDRKTPMMFEYEILSRARANRRHVVLPEGHEERILRAADVLLRKQVCELTLLGDPGAITRRARELNLDLGPARVVDPNTSPWRAEFAQEYARLRAHKGTTIEAAHDAVGELNYFGTMMVHTGRADAMVSGATHPTADTIRPAFEIIKTMPDVAIASSVFFMCLPDRVLVYGDCAINPDPDPVQLADIALSSAKTAIAFGVEPRVAMLSYSTGGSGHGADVDKVAAATALVRAHAPDLAVEGPIQYDAAIDPTVAAAKLPGSPVAGHATVFVFPDLNTGNNTYKAVQRSAGAIAVGPVMQGLRKPVNDLSRGATVADIVNTVAITAIQAASR
jgi:phosphate acetyltransferase